MMFIFVAYLSSTFTKIYFYYCGVICVCAREATAVKSVHFKFGIEISHRQTPHITHHYISIVFKREKKNIELQQNCLIHFCF